MFDMRLYKHEKLYFCYSNEINLGDVMDNSEAIEKKNDDHVFAGYFHCQVKDL